jgi:cell wall-associated NlpC family hydrolase
MQGLSPLEEVHHVGIYIGSGKVVEASSGKGRVVNPRSMGNNELSHLYVWATLLKKKRSYP